MFADNFHWLWDAREPSVMKERRSPLKIFLFESSSSSSVANPKFYECLPASESNKPPQVELLVQLLLNFVVATVLFQLVPQSPKGGGGVPPFRPFWVSFSREKLLSYHPSHRSFDLGRRSLRSFTLWVCSIESRPRRWARCWVLFPIYKFSLFHSISSLQTLP